MPIAWQNSAVAHASCVHRTADADEFTHELLNIANFVHEEGNHQPFALGLHRSDYMLHKQSDGSLQPLQIELNTVAAGFGSLAGRISAMHEALLQHAPALTATAGLLPSYPPHPPRTEPNRPVSNMGAAFAESHKAFLQGTQCADT